jgi:hypothetical protein
VIYARSMRFLRHALARRGTLAAVLSVASVVVAAGCGGDEGRPIPASTARDIVARLDEVERRVAANACNDVRSDSLPALEQQVAGLPGGVDPNVRSTLENGLGRLRELVEAECVEPQTQPPVDTIPDIAPAEPEPTPTPEPQPEPQPDQNPQPGGGGDGDGSGSDGGGSGSDGRGDGSGSDGDGSGFVPDGDGGADPSPGTDPGQGGAVPPSADGIST